MGLSVDVVMPVYEGWKLTERCLEHLGRQEVEHSVFLVDNGSRDGTPDRVRAQFPRVTVLELGEDRGFADPANRGAALGHGDVLLFLSNDVFCRPDFLTHLVTAFEADPQVGSVTPLSVRPDEQTIDCFGIAIDRTLASFIRLSGRPVGEARTTRPLLAGPGGGADAYRRSAFEQVGGFDERLTFYFTDTELTLRLARAGWHAAAAPEAVGVHLRSATTGHRSRFSRASGGWGRGYMLRRYGVLRRRHALRALLTEGLVVASDLALSRDLVALRSRIRGWRDARGLPALEWPPDDLIDSAITFAESVRLRWAAR